MVNPAWRFASLGSFVAATTDSSKKEMVGSSLVLLVESRVRNRVTDEIGGFDVKGCRLSKEDEATLEVASGAEE